MVQIQILIFPSPAKVWEIPKEYRCFLKKITKLNDIYLHKVHKIGKSIEAESRVVVTQGERKGNGKLFLNGLFDCLE